MITTGKRDGSIRIRDLIRDNKLLKGTIKVTMIIMTLITEHIVFFWNIEKYRRIGSLSHW